MNEWIAGIADAIEDAQDGDKYDMALAAVEAMREISFDMQCAGDGLEGRAAWDAMIDEGLDD